MKQKELQEIYFRFLNFLKAVEELPNLPKLDAIESQLLSVFRFKLNMIATVIPNKQTVN